jgi:hypothetical protein
MSVDPTAANGPSLFGGWFTYAPNGQQIGGGASQSWMTVQAASPDQGYSFTADIYTGTGGAFMDPTSPVTIAKVGQATVNFTSCTTMSLTYNFTDGTNSGLGGTMNLVRLGQAPAGCGQ